MDREIKTRKIQDWKRLNSKLLQKTYAFDLYSNRVASPDGSYEDDFFTIDTTDWVNIVPITKSKEVVLIEQFRHGIQSATLEIPGGRIDPGETDPKSAAIRELAEETGYHADQADSLGWIHPNPAIQSNKCHLYVARDVELLFEQNLDDAEDISVVLVGVDEIPTLLESHKITHSLAAIALYRLLLSKQI